MQSCIINLGQASIRTLVVLARIKPFGKNPKRFFVEFFQKNSRSDLLREMLFYIHFFKIAVATRALAIHCTFLESICNIPHKIVLEILTENI